MAKMKLIIVIVCVCVCVENPVNWALVAVSIKREERRLLFE